MVFPTSSPRSSPPGLLSFLLCSLGPIQMFPATTLQKFTKRERERAASCRLGWKWRRRGRVGAATSTGLAGERPRSKNQTHQTPFKVRVNPTPCLGSRGCAGGRGARDSQTAPGPEGEALARLWLRRDQDTMVKTRPQVQTDLAPSQLHVARVSMLWRRWLEL